jgi:catechol 2,3-dioxygenase-like lactoylglutathione lyase family enzyme
MNFSRFEHINLSVQDLEASQRFYQTLFPDWFVRAEGSVQSTAPNGDPLVERWLHLGNQQFYIAINQTTGQQRSHQPYQGLGVNHVGFVIQDSESMKTLLDENGIEYYTYTSPETKLRLYVSDPDGNEIELVEYQKNYALR